MGPRALSPGHLSPRICSAGSCCSLSLFFTITILEMSRLRPDDMVPLFLSSGRTPCCSQMLATSYLRGQEADLTRALPRGLSFPGGGWCQNSTLGLGGTLGECHTSVSYNYTAPCSTFSQTPFLLIGIQTLPDNGSVSYSQFDSIATAFELPLNERSGGLILPRVELKAACHRGKL